MERCEGEWLVCPLDAYQDVMGMGGAGGHDGDLNSLIMVSLVPSSVAH